MNMLNDVLQTAVQGSARRPRKSVVLAMLVASLLSLAGCGGGSGGSDGPAPVSPPGTVTPTPPPPPPPPPAVPVRTAQMQVDPALAAVITETSSIHATVTSGNSIALPVGAPALVFGNNASGEIVALGSADATATSLSLSAIESARTLAWMELGGPMFKSPIKDVKARIDQSPAFAALVAAIDTASRMPEGILQAPVYERLAAVMHELRTPPAPNTTAALTMSSNTFTVRKDFLPKKFLGFVISDIEARRPELDTSNIGLWNAGALEWRARAVPKPGWTTEPGTAMLLPAGSSGFDSYLLGLSQGDIELGLIPGAQLVRIYQDRDTKRKNWGEAVIFGLNQLLSFSPYFDAENKLLTGCFMNTLSAASGIRPEDLADLTPEQATLQNVGTMLKGYFSLTSVTGLYGCLGIPDNFKPNGRFLENNVKKLLNTHAFKILDGLSLANRVATLVKYHNEKDGLQFSVCVANGSVVAEECDIDSTFNVNLVQTSKTVPPMTELTISVDGNPYQIGIFCEADDSAHGAQIISLKGNAATRQITARFMGEDIPATGSYDYRSGAFDISYLTPRTLTVGNPVVSFYEQQQYRVKGKVDLRTGLVQGTFDDLDIVSWTYNAITKECSAVYSFDGGLAPGSK